MPHHYIINKNIKIKYVKRWRNFLYFFITRELSCCIKFLRRFTRAMRYLFQENFAAQYSVMPVCGLGICRSLIHSWRAIYSRLYDAHTDTFQVIIARIIHVSLGYRLFTTDSCQAVKCLYSFARLPDERPRRAAKLFSREISTASALSLSLSLSLSLALSDSLSLRVQRCVAQAHLKRAFAWHLYLHSLLSR